MRRFVNNNGTNRGMRGEAEQSKLHMYSSPLHTLASVPFKWEERPGKPRPSTNINNRPTTKSLEPPPRLYLESFKTPSPTTVLDGPYIISSPKSSSCSFRFLRQGGRGSFDSSSKSPKIGQLSSLVLGKEKMDNGNWWQRNVKGKGDGIRSCSGRMTSFRSNGSYSSLSSKSHMWAAIYEGFKQVIPWKRANSKKEVVEL